MSQFSQTKYQSLQPLFDILPKESYSMSDPELIELVKKKFLIPPSNEDYQLDNEIGFDTSMGQAEVVRRVLGDMVRCYRSYLSSFYLKQGLDFCCC